jgi:type IV secretory pathway VirB2 component (pilin)
MQRLSIAAFALMQAASPFDGFIANLQTFFTGTFAKGMTLVAIVIAGVTYAHSDNGGSKIVARVAIGAAVALMAANIMAWITA